jgi:hypothetical protein
MITFQPCVDHHHNITPQIGCGDLATSAANAWEEQRPRGAPMFLELVDGEFSQPNRPKAAVLANCRRRCGYRSTTVAAPRTPDALVKFEVSISRASPIKR